MIVKNQVELKKLNGLKHMTSKIWIEKSREIIDDIPNDILVKLAYFKFELRNHLWIFLRLKLTFDNNFNYDNQNLN
jgi:hypothetical protein